MLNWEYDIEHILIEFEIQLMDYWQIPNDTRFWIELKHIQRVDITTTSIATTSATTTKFSTTSDKTTDTTITTGTSQVYTTQNTTNPELSLTTMETTMVYSDSATTSDSYDDDELKTENEKIVENVDRLGQISYYTLAGICCVALVVTIIAFIDAKCFRHNELFKWSTMAVSSMYIMDVVSGIYCTHSMRLCYVFCVLCFGFCFEIGNPMKKMPQFFRCIFCNTNVLYCK